MYLPFTPEEELNELKTEGYSIIQRDGRVLVHHPLLGELASKPVDLHNRQTAEVKLQRAAVLYALENFPDFVLENFADFVRWSER